MAEADLQAVHARLGSKEKHRVLIVDDHELLREGLKELLNGEPGLEVCGEAAGEPEAMKLVRSTDPDVVIVDMMLAEGNGLDLIRRISAFNDTIRMIVCSMYEDSLYAERALRAGAAGYVNKQAPANTILEAISQVLAGGIFVNGPMTQRLLRSATGSRNEATQSDIETLSDRELQVFELIGQGFTTGQIAGQLHLSTRTVETYRDRLKTKLHLKHAAELTRDAAQFWLIRSLRK